MSKQPVSPEPEQPHVYAGSGGLCAVCGHGITYWAHDKRHFFVPTPSSSHPATFEEFGSLISRLRSAAARVVPLGVHDELLDIADALALLRAAETQERKP